MKNSFSLILICILLCALVLACGGSSTDSEAPNNTAAEPGSSSAATPKEPESEASETREPREPEAEVETPEPAETGPKRIRFARGSSEGKVDVGLAPGESQRFVIGVSEGQYLWIEVEDFRPTIRMITTSKVTDVTENEQDNTYNALTSANGDIVFEIRNDTRSSIKTSFTVSINFQGE